MASRTTKARHGLEKRFSKGYAFGVWYTLGDSKDNTSEQLTTQGSNAFPQDSRDFNAGTGRATTTSGIACAANFVVNLPLGENVFVRDWVSRASTRGDRAGRSPSTRAATTSAQNMTGLPNSAATRTDRRRSISGSTPPLPGRCRRACSATSSATACEVRATRAST